MTAPMPKLRESEKPKEQQVSPHAYEPVSPVNLPIARGLTPRETEIARLVAKGLPNKAIARILDISPWTIATHLKRIFAKLRINSRIELAVRVAREGEQPLPGAQAPHSQ
jgi:DNA-binding CsgD family transcriptional regulator